MSKGSDGINYSPESWEYSRGYAGVLGSIPSSFTSVTRSLMTDHTNKVARVAGNRKYFVLRLLKSNSLFAPFYFAYQGLALQGNVNEKVTREDLLAYFDPSELSYILGLLFVFRRAQLICDADEFKYISAPLMENVSAGFLAGRAVPAISGSMGMIEGSARYLALATFLKHDVKGFKEYRRECKRLGKATDDLLEVTRWGCTSLQVGSVLLQSLGFGVSRSNSYVNAFATNSDVGSAEDQKLAKDFRMAQLWRRLLQAGKTSPDFAIAAHYYPKKDDITKAADTLKVINQNELLKNWLARTKADLPQMEESVVQTESPTDIEPEILEGLNPDEPIPDGFE